MRKIITRLILAIILILFFTGCENENKEPQGDRLEDIQNQLEETKNTEKLPIEIQTAETLPTEKPTTETPSTESPTTTESTTETIPMILFTETVPPYDWGIETKTRNYIKMDGNIYDNGIIYGLSGAATVDRAFSKHNLDGQYKKIIGYIGHVDGTATTASKILKSEISVSFSFWGDDELLYECNLIATGLPKKISIDVTNIKILKITVNSSYYGLSTSEFAFADVSIE